MNDPMLVTLFNELTKYFERKAYSATEWTASDDLMHAWHELHDLHFWWTARRTLRTPSRNMDEAAAYHRVDTEQMIRLLKVREFMSNPRLQAPLFPLGKRSEMDFLQFRTDDLASEVCCRGNVAAAVVIKTEFELKGDMEANFYSRGEPLDRIRAVRQLLDHLMSQAELKGIPVDEVDRAAGFSPPADPPDY